MINDFLRIDFVRYVLMRINEKLSEYHAVWDLQKRYPGVTIENNVQIKSGKNIKLCTGVIIQRNSVLHGGGLDWCNFVGGIEIGEASCISPGCIFYGTGAKITIGKNFDCGPGVRIFASRTMFDKTFLTERKKPNEHIFSDVIIGNDVIAFSNVIISPGIRIGNGAVIGAGSVVLQDVAPYTFVSGVPARKIAPKPLSNELAVDNDRLLSFEV